MNRPAKALCRWAALAVLLVLPVAGTAAASSPPVLDLSTPAISGLTATVNGYTAPASPGATVTGITWNWGDGTTSVSWFPASHTYAKKGVYNVTATATDSLGNKATAGVTVDLLIPPSPSSGSQALQPLGPIVWQAIGPFGLPNAHVNDPAQASLLSSGRLQAFALDTADPSVMYGGGGMGTGTSGPYTETGVFKSTDGGVTWTPMDHGLTDTAIDALWLDPSHPDTLLATTWTAGVFRSTDAGATWSLVTSGSSTTIVQAHGVVYVGNSRGVIASSDGGATWTVAAATASAVRALAASEGTLYAGLDDGTILVRSSPSSDWTTASTNPGCTVYDLAADPALPQTAVAVLNCRNGGLVNLVTHNGGMNWSPWTPPPSGGFRGSGGPAKVVAFDPINPNTIYAGSGGFLYVSADGGADWTLSHLAEDLNLIEVFVTSGGQRILITGGDQGLYESTDQGTTWSCITQALRTNILTGLAVNGQAILTSVQDFSPAESFDGGHSWNQLTGPNPPLGEDGVVAIDPNDPAHQYAYTVSGFQYSFDGGKTFQTSGSLPNSEFTFAGGSDTLALDPAHPGTMYAAAQGGLFISTDAGETWTNTGWFSTPVSLVVVAPNDPSTLIVGTNPGTDGGTAPPALYITHDGGLQWSHVALAIPAASLAVDPKNPNVVLMGLASPGAAGGLMVSQNGGASFRSAGLPASPSLTPWPWYVWDVSFDPTGSLAVVGTLRGVFAAPAGDLTGHWFDIRGNAVPRVFSGIAWANGEIYASTTGEGVLEVPMAEIAAAVGQYASPQAFRDLPRYAWAAPAVYQLAAQGVVEGAGPNLFDPAGQLTRAQFASLIQRVFRLPQPVAPTAYEDVPEGYWAYPSIEATADFFDTFPAPGGGALFTPGVACSRQEVAAVIVRILIAEHKLTLDSPAQTQSELAQFSDASSISPSLARDVATALSAGILQGTGNGEFQPLASLTRAEVAVLFLRLEAQGLTPTP